MTSQSNPILTLSRKATGTIVPNRLITFAGVQATTLGEKVLGVNKFNVKTGQIAAVDTIGTSVVEAGGIFANGDKLTTDNQGRAVKITNAATQTTFATALEAATAAGQSIEVLLG